MSRLSSERMSCCTLGSAFSLMVSGGRRVGDEKEQQTARYFTLLDELGHLGRNIDKLRSAVRADG